MQKVTKRNLNEHLGTICAKCEKLINSMQTKDGYPRRCPFRSISGDYCDFIENLRKEIKGCYNED